MYNCDIKLNLFGTKEEQIRNETLDLFRQVCNGDSVRYVASCNGLSYETLRDRFKKFIGDDYIEQKGDKGTLIRVIQEYLIKLPEKESKLLREWYMKNYDKLIKDSILVNKGEKTRVYTTEDMEQELQYSKKFDFDIRDAFFL